MKRLIFRILLPVILIAFAASNCLAKQTPDIRDIDTCLIEVVYERIMVRDTLDIDSAIRINNITLRAGNKASAFFSAKRREMDAFLDGGPDAVWAFFTNSEQLQSTAREEGMEIYRFIPENRTKILDRFDGDSWVYEEDTETPQWNITDSITNINGMDCIMATADFRGRQWTAWFAPEIPFSEGPWKLIGLPGLVMKAQDSKKHYTYEAKNVVVNPGGYVKYIDETPQTRFKTRRDIALRDKRKALGKSIINRIAAYGVLTTPPKVSDKPVQKQDLKNYDFEETDYPHE